MKLSDMIHVWQSHLSVRSFKLQINKILIIFLELWCTEESQQIAMIKLLSVNLKLQYFILMDVSSGNHQYKCATYFQIHNNLKISFLFSL